MKNRSEYLPKTLCDAQRQTPELEPAGVMSQNHNETFWIELIMEMEFLLLKHAGGMPNHNETFFIADPGSPARDQAASTL